MDCHLCIKHFTQPCSFYRHLREKHYVKKANIKCELCTKTFSRPHHHKRHLQTHHGEQLGISPLTNRCPICKTKTFKRKDHLQLHLRRCPQLKTATVPLVDLKETEQTKQLKGTNPEPRGSIEGPDQTEQIKQLKATSPEARGSIERTDQTELSRNRTF